MESRHELNNGLQLPVPEAHRSPDRMPFTIRIVERERDLEKAVTIRKAAYGRHLPDFAQHMSVDDCDQSVDTIVLLAESKLDGVPLGTIRIQTNASAPLPVQSSVLLPPWCNRGRLAEATRLGIAAGSPGRMVKVMLFKALFLFCEQQKIDWLIITARSPLDREYEAMLFKDIAEKGRFFPMTHVGGLPHRVMAGAVATARRRWEEARHPLFKFVFETYHPDINVHVKDNLTFMAESEPCTGK
jgi:hypothetical protein